MYKSLYSIFLVVMYQLCVLATPTWQNWPGNYECKGTIVSPQTKNELISVVRDAGTRNKKIRVIGSGHSLNDIACCDDLLISLKNLSEIISVDKVKQKVTVQAGITLEKLNVLLAEQGLALPNLISLTEPTLGGLLATGSHGTGHTGTLSSFVTALELITADGTVHQLSLDSNKAAFNAARVSLGALGVIYSVTLQCEPLFKVTYYKSTMSIDELVGCYQQLHAQNNFFQFRWNVITNVVTTEFWNRVSFDTSLSESVKCSFESLACERGQKFGPVICSEIAVAAELLPQAVHIIKEFVTRWRQAGVEFTNINGRFVQKDEGIYLSPAGTGDAVFLNMNMPVKPNNYQVLQDFEESLYQLKGRPHWGKNHFLSYEKALALYGENLLNFIEVKHQLDPQGIFSNAYINKILSPSLCHN